MHAVLFELRAGHEIPSQELIALYDSVGWETYAVSERHGDLTRALGNSSFVVTARADGILVGLARGLSDDVSIPYLQDVLVSPEYQSQGIGTRLVQACLERYRHVRMCVLLADEDERLSHFYESLGFRNTRDLHASPMNAFIRIGEATLPSGAQGQDGSAIDSGSTHIGLRPSG
ncbi:MAG: GNAT family N-acetyltransferase [Anaerolineae bacterium]